MSLETREGGKEGQKANGKRNEISRGLHRDASHLSLLSLGLTVTLSALENILLHSGQDRLLFGLGFDLLTAFLSLEGFAVGFSFVL